MTYNLKFTYRPLSDSLMIYVDNDRFTNADTVIQTQLGDDLTLEIANIDGFPMFSGVQIMNASFIPVWTEPLNKFLTIQLLDAFIDTLTRLSWKANETEPENIFERIIGERWTMLAERKDLAITIPN